MNQITKKVGKREYFSQYASEKAKSLRSFCLGALSLCVVLIFAAYWIAIHTSFEKIPLVSFSFEVTGDEIGLEDVKKDAGEAANVLSELISNDDFNENQKVLLNNFKVALEKNAVKLSVDNMVRLTKALKGIATDAQLVSQFDFGELQEQIISLGALLRVLKLALMAFSLFIVLITFLGTFFYIRILVACGMIFSVGFSLLFCPLFYLWILLFSFGIIMVLLGKMFAEYKAFQAKIIQERQG